MKLWLKDFGLVFVVALVLHIARGLWERAELSLASDIVWSLIYGFLAAMFSLFFRWYDGKD